MNSSRSIDFADAWRLLGGPEDDHGFEGCRHAAGEGDGSVAGADGDGKLERRPGDARLR